MLFRSQRAVGSLNLEETFTLNRDIQRVLGIDHVALSVNFFGGDNASTGTQHQSSGRLGSRSGLATGLPEAAASGPSFGARFGVKFRF